MTGLQVAGLAGAEPMKLREGKFIAQASGQGFCRSSWPKTLGEYYFLFFRSSGGSCSSSFFLVLAALVFVVVVVVVMVVVVVVVVLVVVVVVVVVGIVRTYWVQSFHRDMVCDSRMD